MAKSKKRSEKQEFFAQQRKTQRKAEAKVAQRKQKRKKAILTTVSVLAVAAVIGGSCTWWVKTKPLTHLLPVMETEHYSINAAELSFYAWQIYDQYLENNSDSDTLPDTTKSLADQTYDGDTTWEDYFMEAAQEYATNVLSYCETSYLAGYEAADDISTVAASSVDGFDMDALPKGVTEDDVIKAMELYILAWDYSSEAQDAITVTAQELEDYYQENAASMETCSYLSFSFSYDDSDETAMQETDAEDLARELRRCTTQDAFENWVYSYYKEHTSLTEEELQSQVSTLRTDEATYNESDEASQWAFDDETQVGDTTIVNDTESSMLTVYLLVSAPERDETYPVDIRQVILTADTYETADGAHDAAEKVLAEYEAGDMTEDSFAALADQYTEDTSADGGLYTDITPSQLMTAWKEWCFDESRQAGDVTILDSSYGSCVLYYVAASEQPQWELTASEAVLTEKQTQWKEDCLSQANVQIKTKRLRFAKIDS